jgi:hypothetical protein
MQFLTAKPLRTARPAFPIFKRCGELGKRKSGTLRYHAFDLLYLDGRDLRQLSYVKPNKSWSGFSKAHPKF